MSLAGHLRKGVSRLSAAKVSVATELWADPSIIRADLFGPERLEHHARTLAEAQAIVARTPRGRGRLARRVKENADALLHAYRFCANAVTEGQPITPAAEWLLDNFHLVEQQLRQITADLPPGYYRQLPKLAGGPLAGYPRVLGLAWGYIAHSDSLLSGPVLARYVKAYQQVEPLMIGELWAVAITLRILLVENMRRLSDQIIEAHRQRRLGDGMVDQALGTTGGEGGNLIAAIAPFQNRDLPEIVAAQIAKRLRGFDPADTPLYVWLDDRLRRQGTTIDQVVANAQSRQGASSITMRNIVTSMRQASELDWADFFEDVSLIDAQLRDHSGFSAMDFATRNRYRAAVESLSRGSGQNESAIVDAALVRADQSADPRQADPGYWLIGPGRGDFERTLSYRAPARVRVHRGIRALGLSGYLAAIVCVTLAALALALAATGVAGGIAKALLAVTGFLAATEPASALVNLVVTRLLPPRLLPAIDLSAGIPADLRTLVAVPVLLADEAALAAEIEQLEVHHLSSVDGALHYALLVDGPDADQESTPQDSRLITAGADAVARLNATYPSDDGPRFFFLYRKRMWNPSEGVWMGWERKRGKLAELNKALRGGQDTSFGPVHDLPQDVRFVITLDADTRLLRDTVHRLIGKMAHPLNRARVDDVTRRVVEGYGILQPRVTPSLPTARQGSLFQSISSSPGGVDPYPAAVSDVYQDLFAEGSFTGKGIYDVDAFEAALAGRVPDNTMLSHDLFEGIFARAGLTSDIEVVEDFPARYDVASRRQHRWVRGDWQLLPWLLARSESASDHIPPVGRWKMVDNLRRSLVAPMSLLSITVGWFLPLPVAVAWTLAVLGLLALPRLFSLPFAILPGRAGITSRSHLAALWTDTRLALAQIALTVVFLADTAWQMLDAMARTFYRLRSSRRHLLQWTTAAQTARTARTGWLAQYAHMAGGVALGLVAGCLAVVVNPAIWPLAAIFALLWTAAPAIAHWISQPYALVATAPLGTVEVQSLRLIARRTWQYFETFVTAQENDLPPDNFQEIPTPAIAHRTSPTNIGLYLLSTVTAHDMGWIGLDDALARLERTLATMARMGRFRGHFYNWYDTRDLRILDPAYVSSVDSGNLAGHLIAVSQSCRHWAGFRTGNAARLAGVRDTFLMVSDAVASLTDPNVQRAVSQFQTALDASVAVDDSLSAGARALVDTLAATAGANADMIALTQTLDQCIAAHLSDAMAGGKHDARIAAVANTARQFAMEMEFGFLLDPDKMLLSIGFSVATNALDANCYDLLASEARLASLFAIAKGDVETRHWFRLGRAATPIGAGSVLISWSGSMFEYLMPSLVMRAPLGSVLEQTNRLIVTRQMGYAGALGLPWGISESSYNARDLEMTYQYSNFGVPGLGLKRGLSENRVIAPYATGLATMVDPQGALRNYDKLAALGGSGRFGFFEAVDFTPSRLPDDVPFAVVRSFMAHHQGMTITAIANAVQDGVLRSRFHAEPIIQAVELLLQERVPRDADAAPPRAQEVLAGMAEAGDASVVRAFPRPMDATRTAHLLSNGSYGVMVTPTGAGFSTWRDLAITRWRADPTQASHGSFIYLQDVTSGDLWSAGVQPTGADGEGHRAVFCEHHAAFTHERDHLGTTTEVVVSSEDDAEARRVTLTNTGNTPRVIDLTSYAELVLAPASADLAHPAFSKMFVVTDYLPELEVIIASRRRRSAQEAEVWAAHIAIVEGHETADIQFETDRARFIGRGRTVADAAMATAPLSGTVGTVLDPIFSLRRRVLVPPGGTVKVTFWTLVAEAPDKLLDMVERHRDVSSFERAVTLAWTQGQVQLRHLGISKAAASDFQELAGMLIRGDARLRTTAAQIERGAGPQSRLWVHGISGDLPILLFIISDPEDAPRLHEVLAAQEYLRMRQFAVDLVILNDRSASYIQDLQIAIEAAARAAQARPRGPGKQGWAKGAIHSLRADMLTSEARDTLFSVASVVLRADRGSIGDQIAALPSPALQLTYRPRPALPPSAQGDADAADGVQQGLEFFNGHGGFADNGREYVTLLRDGQITPAPWVNVVANPDFGFLVSATGGGHVWAENSRENQLTPWSNDPVCDPVGEAIYLKDLTDGTVWTPTALPIRGPGTYIARHGFGYSSFTHTAHGIAATVTQFVPLDDPVKISRITLHNQSDRARSLSVTGYAEWVLGTSRSATARHIITRKDPKTSAVLATNPFTTAFPGRVAFADLGAGADTATGDRASFLGQGGTMANPQGLRAAVLSERFGPALDPCAAIQRRVTLAPGEQVELVFLVGQAKSDDAARDMIARLRAADVSAILRDVKDHWSAILTTVQVTSPDRTMDILLNGWLLYQTLCCRIWARTGFYQASGAYGFRDQLQDGMALTAIRPDLTRSHLLRAASRQFPEGDVQHWWLPHSGQGVRTRISDDRVWLAYGVAQYIATAGDAGVLDEQVAFLEGHALLPGAHDDFFQPGISDTTASLFEHCARGLDLAVTMTGANGMPLIGTGDWNDGMNRVGEHGQGTSVWLGWLFIATVDAFAPFADQRDPDRAARWRAHRDRVLAAIEGEGWDGAWYRRGTYDDGSLLGSASSEECRIDSIAQSWAVLSGAADPARARQAMRSLTDALVRPDPGLALLFTPPFDRTPLDPGYIKQYPPGLRENGGQYSHAAMWAILAQARLGDGDAAGGLFALLNPINHALTPEAAQQYKVEPYVIAADVYSTDPHEGRGGWTWYTGSAGWMYRAGIEGLLGLTRFGDRLSFNPCFPIAWPELRASVGYGKGRLAVVILNPGKSGHGIAKADLDGQQIAVEGGRISIPLSDAGATLTIHLGDQQTST